MAGSFANFAENKVLDHLCGDTSWTMPTTYIARYTVAPTDAGGGTEVSGGTYARVALSGKFGAAASGSKTTTADILFPEATSNEGTTVAIAILDASTAGNFLAWGDVAVSKAVASGDQAKIAAGNLTITLD